MNPATLAAVRAEITTIVELCSQDGQVLSELISDMLEGSTDFHRVLSRAVRMRERAKADMAGAKHAKAEVAAHYDGRIAIAEREKRAAERIITALMADAKQTSVRLPEGSVSVRPGNERLVIEPGFNAQGYMREVRSYEPNKEAIEEALRNGAELPGADLVTGNPIVSVR